MIQGKTKTGFAYQLDDDAMNNMELVDAMAELDDGGHPFALSRVCLLLLGKDQRFVNRVKIARRQFGQTREPFRNIGTGLLAALAATHAVAHHIHAVACAGAVLVVFPTQADIAVQTDLNMFDVHESRPFTPIFRKRIFRKWNTSASDSFARHLRNVGSEPSMNFRSSAMSCQ